MAVFGFLRGIPRPSLAPVRFLSRPPLTKSRLTAKYILSRRYLLEGWYPFSIGKTVKKYESRSLNEFMTLQLPSIGSCPKVRLDLKSAKRQGERETFS